jgi:hypothetical protein
VAPLGVGGGRLEFVRKERECSKKKIEPDSCWTRTYWKKMGAVGMI